MTYLNVKILTGKMEIALLAFGMIALIALARSIKELDRKEDEFTNRFEE
jgi:hypothetical protein